MKNYIKILALSAIFTMSNLLIVYAIPTNEAQKSPTLPWQWTLSWYYFYWQCPGWAYGNLPETRFSCKAWTCATANWGWVVYDSVTKLNWQSVNWTNTNFSLALSYCDNLILWWHDDWRLPNIRELLSISDNSYTNSTYWDDTYFNWTAANYWSSTTYASDTTKAYWVNWTANTADSKSVSNYVRCVR